MPPWKRRCWSWLSVWNRFWNDFPVKWNPINPMWSYYYISCVRRDGSLMSNFWQCQQPCVARRVTYNFTRFAANDVKGWQVAAGNRASFPWRQRDFFVKTWSPNFRCALCSRQWPDLYWRRIIRLGHELRQRTIVRLIIRLHINTGKQTDHPSRRTIWIIRLHRRITGDNSSERIIRLWNQR